MGIKLLTRDTDYAIRALCFAAKHKKKIISASELTKNLKIPRQFLRKILQILSKNNVLKSYKGKSGGFTLHMRPNEISLIYILNIFQGPLRLNECLFKKRICSDVKTCILKKRMDAIEKYVISKLKSITVANLIK